MERIMLEILAEEAQKGNKPSNFFKPTSFHRVTTTISERFDVVCESDHVENQLKTFECTWQLITTIRGSNGFGWDDKLKMIVAAKKPYEEALEAHPKWEYLNKKLEMYDEMSLTAWIPTLEFDFTTSADR
ncbi:hypothetical protein CCACVL1_28789 [Corchorus capsularis]|uniref:Myb/SANT-like domain-containing protein n=1 Tax=Corchorus capsularis TaxID=210143 RepID=A0A1R3G5C9_COCAP|nr:hypothetical protein CCACVL1_28789 [Corchorus capsularis]